LVLSTQNPQKLIPIKKEKKKKKKTMLSIKNLEKSEFTGRVAILCLSNF